MNRFLKQQWDWRNEPWNEIDYRAALALLFACLYMFSAHAADGDFAYRVKVEKADTVSHGTACAISAHTLVTAAHVIAGGDEIFIDHEIGWLRCKVVKSDAETDIAIIECKSVELKYAPIDTAQRVAGESVTIWASVAGTKIKALTTSLKEALNAHQWLCSAPGFDHGGSGSPVVKDNRLVGVATAMESDGHGHGITGTAVFVASDCIQHVLAPETFKGEVLAAPKDTRAEVVALPVVKESGHADGMRVPVNLSARLLTETAEGTTCRAGHCRSAACVSSIEHKSRCVSENAKYETRRHWDSDADRHGQGGWVSE